MKDKTKNELKLSIILKSIIILGGICGLIASFLMTEIGAQNEVLYYTIQSNICIVAMMIVFLTLNIIAIKKGGKNIPNWLLTVKFVFTVAITLTCIVYNFVLFPASLATPTPTNPLEIDSFLMHIFVPVLSIADFIKFDYKLIINKWTALYGLITPLYYFPFALIVAQLGATFKGGERFPYFFLNYEKLSWFGFSGMPGVFYWLIIVLGIVLGISYLLLICQKKRKNCEKIKKFTQFCKDYSLKYEKLTQKDEKIYFKNIVIEDENGNKVFEGEDFINTGYNSKNSISKVLSNLYPHKFKFRGKKVGSIEGVLQGAKYKDKKLQNSVLKLAGADAYHSRACNRADFWGDDGVLYWQGKAMRRNSQDYQEFLDELYISALGSPLYKKAILSTGDKYLMHHIGCEDENQTVLTRYEYEFRMNALRDFLNDEEANEGLFK